MSHEWRRELGMPIEESERRSFEFSRWILQALLAFNFWMPLHAAAQSRLYSSPLSGLGDPRPGRAMHEGSWDRRSVSATPEQARPRAPERMVALRDRTREAHRRGTGTPLWRTDASSVRKRQPQSPNRRRLEGGRPASRAEPAVGRRDVEGRPRRQA